MVVAGSDMDSAGAISAHRPTFRGCAGHPPCLLGQVGSDQWWKLHSMKSDQKGTRTAGLATSPVWRGRPKGCAGPSFWDAPARIGADGATAARGVTPGAAGAHAPGGPR